MLGLAMVASAQGQGFEARLQALAAAVDQHLATTAVADVPPPPPEWRKVLWFHLVGDRHPDALVVLRSRRDECAAAASGARPCRALVLAGSDSGAFRVVTEFTLRVHPVALLRTPEGMRDLFYARDTGAQPVYARYRFNGSAFGRVEGPEGEATAEQLQKLPLLVADDRSMPLLADQQYAARHFPNDGARLAPFRLHLDAVGMADLRIRKRLFDDRADERGRAQLAALLPEAQAWVAALSWPQTLELRLWSCHDWMIERRFWEVENRRLGRPGACIEPSLFALKQGLVKQPEAALDLTRLQLLHQVGAAWALRVAPLAAGTVARWRSAAEPAAMQFVAAVAGQALALQGRQLSADRIGDALVGLRQVSARWFEVHESQQMRYVLPTPELRAFDASLDVAEMAHQCVRRVLGQPPAKAFQKVDCDPQALELSRQLVGLLQGDLKR